MTAMFFKRVASSGSRLRLRATLRGLPKTKITTTWVPRTHQRLSSASGYGAGIGSPGWYHHLWSAPDDPVARWLTRVAGALRTRDLPVSSAAVIEAVRRPDAEALIYFRYERIIQDLGEFGTSVFLDEGISEEMRAEQAALAMSFFAPGADIDAAETVSLDQASPPAA